MPSVTESSKLQKASNRGREEIAEWCEWPCVTSWNGVFSLNSLCPSKMKLLLIKGRMKVACSHPLDCDTCLHCRRKLRFLILTFNTLAAYTHIHTSISWSNPGLASTIALLWWNTHQHSALHNHSVICSSYIRKFNAKLSTLQMLTSCQHQPSVACFVYIQLPYKAS